MAEYYTVLRRAIGGIDPNVPETRRAVYDKARNALIGQLKAVDPPLTTAEISRQRLELEEAIRRVEREAAAGLGGAPAPRPRTPPPPANRVAPRPAQPAPAGMPPGHDYDAPPPSPQEVFRRAVQEAGMRGGETDRTTPAPVARYEAPAPEVRGAPRGERPAPRGEAPDRAFPVRGDAPRYAPPEYRRRQAPPPPPPEDAYDESEQGHEPYDAEPRLAPEYDQDWQGQAAAQAPPTPQVDRRERVAVAPSGARARTSYEAPEADAGAEPKPKRSRLGGILVTVLILLILGGAGVFAWTQRSMIEDLVAGFTGTEAPGTTATAPEQPLLPPAPDVPAATADSGKNTDRLLPGEAAPPGSEVRVVGSEETADGGVATAEPIPASASPTESATAAAPTDSGKKAILYEEPVDGAAPDATVTAVNAVVNWKFVNDGPNGPQVEASLAVPDRDMTITFSLHKNADDTLPASHLVEVVVDTPADFPGKSIGSIPRIVLKPTESARGQPLVGAAAKVADGFFWIALSAADTDIASNLSLIRDRNWIDLPFVYENGQRAILTFEKGPEGEAAFQQALAAWGT